MSKYVRKNTPKKGGNPAFSTHTILYIPRIHELARVDAIFKTTSTLYIVRFTEDINKNTGNIPRF